VERKRYSRCLDSAAILRGVRKGAVRSHFDEYRLLIQVAANDSFRVADTGTDHFWFILENSSGATGLETVGRSGEGRSASQL